VTLAAPLSYGGQSYGELLMDFDPAEKNNALWRDLIRYVKLVGLALIFISGFVYWVLRRNLHTIADLVKAVAQMQSGNYHYMVPEQGAPELRLLVRAFNEGNARLGGLIKTLRQRDMELVEQLDQVRVKNFALQEQHRAVDAAAILVETDLAGDITYVNEKFVAISGYSREELIGKNHRIVNSGVHTREFFTELWATIASGKVWHGEVCNRAKNGSLYWVDTTIVPIMDEQTERPLRYKAIRFDITARKLAENQALSISHQLGSVMRAAVEVAIIATDLHGVITLFNEGAQRMLGYAAAELVGKSTFAAFHLAEEVAAYGAVLSAEFGREIAGFEVFVTRSVIDGQERREWTYVRKDGVHIQVSLGVTPVRDLQGEITGYLGIALDVTQRKALESALYLEKERAEVTLASIGDAVLTTDALGNVVFLNQVAQQLTGWTQRDAVGLPIEQVFHIVNENTRVIVSNPVREALTSGSVVALANHTLLLAQDGTEYHIEDSAAPIRMNNGSMLGCVLVFHDVSEKYRLMSAVRWQAGHDVLTNLPNRALLNDRFILTLANARRSNTLTAVCLLDLDDFKPINDTYGHEAGDAVLIEVARRLSMVIRGEDTAARLGGDEFVLLINELHDVDEIEIAMCRILAAIAQPYKIGNVAINVSASLGVTIYPLDEADADTLMRHADQAMYQAKLGGRNRYHLFDVDKDVATRTNLERVNRVRQALYADELVLYYQPKVNMRTGTIQGMEALLRWQHPEQGLVPPLEFLPLVEQTDLIIEIGEWVIVQALQQIERWLQFGRSWEVSVNIAGLHFQQVNFAERLTQLLAQYPNVPANLLEIEILESATIGNLDYARDTIERCQAMGVRFALDDFGTGYSSLSYLKRLPADVLKIDQSFVRDMLSDKSGIALIEAVISLAKVFGNEVIAEGVETSEHGVLLLRLGCDRGQGYGIARPMPAANVLDWAQQYKPDSNWQLWANAHWDLSDFPLLIAQYDHLTWIKKVMSSVFNEPLAMPEAELVDHHQCRFGRWFYSIGKQRYGYLPEYAALESVHADVHQVGHEIVRLHAAGKVAAAKQLTERLLSLKDQVLILLSDLQRKVAREIKTD
jgi:diguanylate cyclase (GGDEF)-like protein/PAS domain S-box-containing protein